jgi:CRISPR-associated protein (TIGR03986 family)
VIQIDSQAVKDYVAALTPFQKEPPFDERYGVLQEGKPVFYVKPVKGGKIQRFGHTPNFRIAHLITVDGVERAATPVGFIPESLRSEDDLDMTDAVFGYIRSRKWRQKNSDERHSYGSRVYISDAYLEGNPENIYWNKYDGNVIVPRILASPKPTAFQFYLTQNSSEKSELNHYGKPTPHESVARGYKHYWHRGKQLQVDDVREPRKIGKEDGDLPENSTQHTTIKPLRSNLTFHFKVYFDNLSEIELGALAWVLELPEGHCHKIGMGKPLGLGSVFLHDIDLHIDDRDLRYTNLFDGLQWAQPHTDKLTIQQYKNKFTQQMCALPWIHEAQFQSVSRIQMLLAMLQWNQRDDNWLEATRYLQLGHGDEKNEYDAQDVLADPKFYVEHHKPVAALPDKPSKPRIRVVEWSENMEILASVKSTVKKKDALTRGVDLLLPPILLSYIPNGKEPYVYIPAKYVENRNYNKGAYVNCSVVKIIEDEDTFILECRPL